MIEVFIAMSRVIHISSYASHKFAEYFKIGVWNSLLF